MKRTLLIITALFITICCKAQENGLTFPFQGGSAIMTRFFKDSLVVSPDIIQQRATGVVVFKFTADYKGKITKIIIAYADDYILTPPLIEALRKSNHKWIIHRPPLPIRCKNSIMPITSSAAPSFPPTRYRWMMRRFCRLWW
jgi:hypothetical protein